MLCSVSTLPSGPDLHCQASIARPPLPGLQGRWRESEWWKRLDINIHCPAHSWPVNLVHSRDTSVRILSDPSLCHIWVLFDLIWSGLSLICDLTWSESDLWSGLIDLGSSLIWSGPLLVWVRCESKVRGVSLSTAHSCEVFEVE